MKMKYQSLSAALLLAFSSSLAVADQLSASFIDETETSHLASTFTGDVGYMVGGGVATFDCNNDGKADVLLAGGESQASFYRNDSMVGGALDFVKQQSGLEVDKLLGAYPLDIDSDGMLDLVLLRQGENLLMRGLGACKFAKANQLWGFDGGKAWSTSFAATWEKGQTWPTLAIGNYIDPEEEINPWGSCTDNWLHRPRIDGQGFAPPLALKPSFCPLSMMFSDWNRSGQPSLRVSNDRQYYEGGQEQMWHVEQGQPPRLYTPEEGWQVLRIWGMGIASYDLNGDRYPEYFLTSMADNKLQSLKALPEQGPPKPQFKDIAFAKGVAAHRPGHGTDLRPSTAWHTQFDDMNNDGLVDLFIAKGNVAEMPDFAMKDPNNLFLQKTDGSFVDMAEKAGVDSTAISRGGAIADFNLDGLLDLLVVNRGSPAQIWRNTTAGAGHWLAIDLQQPGANRNAIGAWLEVKVGERVQRREITSGGGHASGQIGWWHVGLGAAPEAAVRVIWPDGSEGPWETVKADAFYIAARDRPISLWPLK